MKPGTKFKQSIIYTVNKTSFFLILLIDFPNRIKEYLRQVEEKINNNLNYRIKVFIFICLMFFTMNIFINENPLHFGIPFGVLLLTTIAALYFKLKSNLGYKQYKNKDLDGYIEKIRSRDSRTDLDNLNTEKKEKNEITKVKKILFDKRVKPQVIKELCKLYFEKYIPKINVFHFLYCCTNYAELSSQTFTCTPKEIKLKSQERQDLFMFINYLIEKKILYKDGKQNSSINSQNTIYESLIHNLKLQRFSLSTAKSDMLKFKTIPKNIKQELNSCLDKHNLP